MLKQHRHGENCLKVKGDTEQRHANWPEDTDVCKCCHLQALYSCFINIYSVNYYAQTCISDVLNGCSMYQLCDQCVTEMHKI